MSGLVEPLGEINSAEAAALTLIRGVHPNERTEALEWFRKNATKRQIREVVLRAMERYTAENKSPETPKR